MTEPDAPASTDEASASASASGTTVRARFRPRSAKEAGVRCVDYQGAATIAFTGPDGGRNTFGFDKVYGEAASQADVFRDLRFVVEAALQGYNGTIMAYGQTGSGKTHTLIGSVADPAQHGVVPRAISHLAGGIAEAGERDGADFQVGLGVVEIYCERIRDLLDPARDNLAVKQDAARGVYIEGASEVAVTDERQLLDFMGRGLAQRSVAATAMNETSSRSHCIVTVRADKTLRDGTVQSGKLVMVDLAGSERADRTNAMGATLAEGALINKSLSCLSNVIQALTDDAKGGKPRHVPYRDSKLTRVLQDSLGGSARTVLIVCCSPCLENAAETLSTLRFGARARGVQNTVTVNQRISPQKLLQQVEELKARNLQLAAELLAARALAAADVAADGSVNGSSGGGVGAVAGGGAPPPTAAVEPAAGAGEGKRDGGAVGCGGGGSRSGGSVPCSAGSSGVGAPSEIFSMRALTVRVRDAADAARLLLAGRTARAGLGGGPGGGGSSRPSLRQAEALVDVSAAALLALGLAACALCSR